MNVAVWRGEPGAPGPAGAAAGAARILDHGVERWEGRPSDLVFRVARDQGMERAHEGHPPVLRFVRVVAHGRPTV